MNINEEKRRLRKKIIKKREGIPCEIRKDADIAININLSKLIKNNNIKINAYISDGFEPDINHFIKTNILNMGNKVIIPRYNKGIEHINYEMVFIENLTSDLCLGKYNILEPKNNLKALNPNDYIRESWIVPGVAFDITGQRLGRGKGVYDYFLNKSTGMKIGVFYECQKIKNVPVTKFDERLDYVVTEKCIYKIKNKGV